MENAACQDNLLGGIIHSRGAFSEQIDGPLTECISALPSFDKIWKALVGQAESSPPLFHLIFRLSAARPADSLDRRTDSFYVAGGWLRSTVFCKLDYTGVPKREKA